jgi:hypothetical protein
MKTQTMRHCFPGTPRVKETSNNYDRQMQNRRINEYVNGWMIGWMDEQQFH